MKGTWLTWWTFGIASLAVMALPCLAGEVAVLKNGFAIRHERREVVGTVTRLYVNADGSSFVDVPTDEIEHFEAAPEAPASDASPATTGRKDVPSNLSVSPVGFPGGRSNAQLSSLLNPQNSRISGANLKSTSRFPAPSKGDLTAFVNEASGRYRLDPDLVNSVIKAESGFNSRAISPKGAQGLMQLMPGTASELGVGNAFDAHANVEGGTKYLRELLERYNFDLVKALAAYNAGPERVEKFGGVPPYYETRTYVARIVKDFNKKKVAQEKAAAAQKRASTKQASAKQGTATAKSSAAPKGATTGATE